ncbi:MAG TPA: nitroreductase/quinone reductase family protein [Actinomycetes bacterium]|nr:nitroreductase/quinone reductase family protein [Actinomycetes bacterium]
MAGRPAHAPAPTEDPRPDRGGGQLHRRGPSPRSAGARAGDGELGVGAHARAHPGHVAYLRRGDGVLIAGDAALTVDLNSVGGVLLGRQRVAGPPRYTTSDWPAATRSVGVLADLEPRVLVPGHGRPLSVGTAAALAALAQDRPRARSGRRGLRGLVPRYSASDRYRPPPRLYARLQWLGFALTWLGLSPRYVVTLEVPGRRSGVTRRTNLVLAEHDGERYLVALAGESQWVRNVGAAGGRGGARTVPPAA